MQKSFFALLLSLALLFAGCAAPAAPAESAPTEPTPAAAPAAPATEAATEPLSGKIPIEIDVKDYGTIKAELDADAAPLSVANFLALARAGFYDGLTFHRIMDGFMIQGGDPTGTGMGGVEPKLKGEFAANNVNNPLSHVRGTISMARSQDYNSASCQFFIVQSDSTFLDGQYAAFGTVTEGMDIVDKICKDAPVQDNNGTVLAADQPVIEAVRVMG